MGLFPAYIENGIVSEVKQQSVVPREYGIDFKSGQLTGEIVEGLEAIKVWIWFALQIPRYRYYAYTWDYGNEFEELIGQGYSSDYIDSESRRMTEDCLLVNSDIQGISDFQINITGDTLTISFIVNTVYGDIAFQDYAIGR
ncbi:MAG: DUF2634 domain-containing protein [Lachnospiraceae bacterium]